MEFGNDQQKEKFVRPFTDGSRVGCFALSEPGEGGAWIQSPFHILLSIVVKTNVKQSRQIIPISMFR